MVVELRTRDDVVEADRRIAELSRGAGRLRLRVGEGLDTLEQTAGFAEVGFSSIRGR
jgi:hypothetical protein